MPPFGLKAFTRRKSGGNSLEVAADTSGPAPPSTGFRVIPRNEAHRKSIGTLDAPTIPYQVARQSSHDEDSNSSNRGSNSSAATSAKSRIFDPPATRFSSSSTLHSPAEPVLKKAQSSPNWLNLSQDLDSGFDDDMFSALQSSHRPSRAMEQPSSVRQPPPTLRLHTEADLPKRDLQQSPFWNRRSSTDKLMASPRLSESPVYDEPPPPAPPHKDPPKAIKTFPYLPINDSSSDELSPPLPTHELRNQPSFNRSPDGNEDADARMVRESVRSVRGGPTGRNSGYEGSPLGRANKIAEKGLLPPQGKVISHSSSDNSLKTPSIGSSASSTPLDHRSFLGHSSDITPVASNLQGSSSNSTTPRATRTLSAIEGGESHYDPSVVNAIRQTETRSMLGLPSHTKSGSQTGVMTAAQFAALKEQEKKVAGNGKAPVESESDDDYEDDSDDEEVQAQKRKLQAHKEAQHAIWRQRMKKDIGDHSGPARPDYSRNNMSAPNLSYGQSNAGSDDEDDDVPLAILQAHNFPNNNRPPDPRNSSNSFVGNQLPRPGSAGARPSNKTRGSNLPIFAPRVNPQDLPYVGADLVQGGNREQLRFNNPGAMSQYGAAPRGPPPRNANLPPNGLIGIIVDEERGKAARRGSPNGPNGMGYLPAAGQMGPMPGLGPQMPMGHMGGYGMPVEPQFQQQQQQQQIAALQQQIALQQQLYELQSQNMQLGMGGGSVMGSGQSMMGVAPMMSNQSMMGPPFMAGGNQYGNRPMSVATNGGAGPRPPLHQARTKSMASQAGYMQPNARAMSMASFNLPAMSNLPPFAPGYAPSVAPSERSNIGQPSRYKPVSFPDGGSTITAGSTAAQHGLNDALNKKKSGGFLNAMMHHGGKKSPSVGKHDDEDEEDWSKVLRKRKSAKTEK
ncbi:hypothetical protein Vi05172_g10409 [Venturia inaequalis]|nr:hypothetical protein Vi05172_g10409 [Venturia inaequalis]